MPKVFKSPMKVIVVHVDNGILWKGLRASEKGSLLKPNSHSCPSRRNPKLKLVKDIFDEAHKEERSAKGLEWDEGYGLQIEYMTLFAKDG